jgi:hypothetical protein
MTSVRRVHRSIGATLAIALSMLASTACTSQESADPAPVRPQPCNTLDEVAPSDPTTVDPSTTVSPGSPATTSTPPASTIDVAGPATFPLVVDVERRLIRDAEDRPFLLHGDTAWALIADLTRDDVDRYLADRKSRGFNTILVSLLEHQFATNAPSNIYGEPPFLVPGDYTTPNEAYFEHAAWVLRRAEEEGFLVLLTPSYVGFRDTAEGWYNEMEASGVENLEQFGRFLGERFSERSNILWVQGGDDDPPDKALAGAIATGLLETDADALHTAHGAPEQRRTEYWGDFPWFTLNNVYTYGDVYQASIEEYRDGNTPFILFESAYENEHGATSERLRTQAYHALLGGAVGQIFGNNPIWHFDGPGLFPTDFDWREALDSPGSRSMSHLHKLFSSLEWWRLLPDLDGNFLTGDVGSGMQRAVAGLACDRSFALIYIPDGREITLDLSLIDGGGSRLSWYDPAAGSITPAADSVIPTDGQHTFRPPGPNADGAADWVLLVEGD